jgi:hypothetical protein
MSMLLGEIVSSREARQQQRQWHSCQEFPDAPTVDAVSLIA